MKQSITKSIKVFFLAAIWSCLTAVSAQNTIKILAIGNSFSEDAAESYIDDLAKADNVEVIIGNMFIGGCSLETHWIKANANSPAYSYRKIVNGVKTTVSSKTLRGAITDESWDYITFQQVSQYSGKYITYFPYLPNLLNYVKALATNPNVKYCLHRTWAYSKTSTHSEYDYYQKDQMIMYDSIVAVTNKVADKVGISIIIPAGTAIQNGRSSYIGDNFNRDGYHLSLGLGRYTAACTWYEILLGKSVINNTFIPSGVTANEAKIAKNAAHYAVQTPNVVTSMAPTELSKNINSERNFRLYPNPVKDIVNLESDRELKSLDIFDLTGKINFTQNNIKTHFVKLDLSMLDKGYYILKSENECIPFVKK